MPDIKINEEWLQDNGKYKCPHCNKEYSKYGIATHIFRSHTDEGKIFDPNKGYKDGSREGWCKGLTKETSDSLKNMAETLSKNKKGKPTHEWTIESKQKISKALIKAHKEVRAHNIKDSGYSYYSKISQELFWEIYNQLPEELKQYIHFAELNREKFFRFNDTCIAIDFYISNIKYCIEFNGDMWHANPNIYNENDKPLKNERLKEITAKEIWNKDKERKEFLNSKDICVDIIWEKDYKQNKDIIIKNCINKILNMVSMA